MYYFIQQFTTFLYPEFGSRTIEDITIARAGVWKILRLKKDLANVGFIACTASENNRIASSDVEK